MSRRRGEDQPCYLCDRRLMHRLVSSIPICEPCLEYHDIPVDAPTAPSMQTAFANPWRDLASYDGE